MTDTMISLSEESQTKLRQLAQEQGKTPTEVIEEMIHFYITHQSKKMPKCLGKGKSNLSNLSERVDELLWQD
jgi:hypothetical protein